MSVFGAFVCLGIVNTMQIIFFIHCIFYIYYDGVVSLAELTILNNLSSFKTVHFCDVW